MMRGATLSSVTGIQFRLHARILLFRAVEILISPLSFLCAFIYSFVCILPNRHRDIYVFRDGGFGHTIMQPAAWVIWKRTSHGLALIPHQPGRYNSKLAQLVANPKLLFVPGAIGFRFAGRKFIFGSHASWLGLRLATTASHRLRFTKRADDFSIIEQSLLSTRFGVFGLRTVQAWLSFTVSQKPSEGYWLWDHERLHELKTHFQGPERRLCCLYLRNKGLKGATDEWLRNGSGLDAYWQSFQLLAAAGYKTIVVGDQPKSKELAQQLKALNVFFSSELMPEGSLAELVPAIICDLYIGDMGGNNALTYFSPAVKLILNGFPLWNGVPLATNAYKRIVPQGADSSNGLALLHYSDDATPSSSAFSLESMTSQDIFRAIKDTLAGSTGIPTRAAFAGFESSSIIQECNDTWIWKYQAVSGKLWPPRLV